MISQISKIFKLQKHEEVKYSTLEKVPFGVWIDLFTSEKAEAGSMVKFRRIHSKAKNQLLFLTEIDAGAGYNYHSHDCKETITVLDGSVFINGGALVHQFGQRTFFADTLHRVYAQTRARLLVEFTKIRK